MIETLWTENMYAKRKYNPKDSKEKKTHVKENKI